MRGTGQLAILLCAVLGVTARAQVLRPTGTYPHAPSPSAVTPTTPPTAKTPTAAPASSPASSNLPPSLLDQPARPARVELLNGKLSIDAQNSSLSAILRQISADTGMKVEGFSADQRIFGTYGPGTSREVLLSLLDGSGYNVVMVGGTAKEAPLRLELSSPTQASAAPAAATPTQAYQSSDDSDDNASSGPTRPAVYPRQQPQQPEGQHPPPSGVRTPQQLLQQLQQMHEREMQQQQQPQ